MSSKKLFISIILIVICIKVSAQTFYKNHTDIYDTVWQTSPMGIYSPGHGALISGSVAGFDPGIPGSYYYNYTLHVDHNGDTAWSRRYLLDTVVSIPYSFLDSFGVSYYLPDTVLDTFKGSLQTVMRDDATGNYLFAGTTLTSGRCVYLIKQIDSMGNDVSGHIIILDSTIAYGSGLSIKLLPANSGTFYLLYNIDSMGLVYDSSTATYIDTIVQSCYVKKLDNHYNEIWSKTYRCGYNDATLWYTDAVDIDNACLTTDTDIAFVKVLDTSMSGQYDYILEKLNSDGAVILDVNLKSILPSAVSAGGDFGFVTPLPLTVALIPTNDSGILWRATQYITTYKTYLLKVNSTGVLTDSIGFANDTATPYNGVETSNGKFLFAGLYTPSFMVFDNHLNYLYSLPYPFADLGPTFCSGLVANEYGGAFCTYSSSNGSYISDWYNALINFDSSFYYYPSFISGNVYQDNNNDCLYNSGDVKLPGTAVTVHDGVTDDYYYGFTNDTGGYKISVPNGSYTVTHTPSGYEANECGTYAYTITTPSALNNNNFSDTLRTVSDLMMWMNSYCLVPGSITELLTTAYNNGTTTVDTTITVILDNNTSFVSSSPAPLRSSGDTLVYHLSLMPDSFTALYININVSTSASIGDILTFSATSPFHDNIVITDDSVVYNGTIVSSYDPNIKSVNQPLYFHKNSTMVYNVEFQNTGTYAAKNVVVIDTLDNHLDPATFHLLNSSPFLPTVVWRNGNRIYANFDNINLPDSTSNQVASHGYFSYAINTRSTASIGDTIHNTASIFFDYNLPVVTNTTTNIIDAPFTTAEANTIKNDDIKLYPNPTSGSISIRVPSSTDTWQVILSDVTGHEISRSVYNGQLINLKMNVNAGVYFIQMIDIQTTETFVRKIVVDKQ